MTQKNRPVETLRATSPSHYNGYLIPSSRLKDWDYSASGLYFVTICTQERHPHFGAIANGELYLSPAGVIAGLLWCSIPDHCPRAVCGEFVVMPNHVHGVLWQPRYHDHVIRSEASLRQIERYIAENPTRWQTDEYHP